MFILRALARVLIVGVAAVTLGGAFLVTATAAAEPDVTEASRFIQDLGDKAIRILRQPEQSLADREAALRDLLREGFALPLIARFSLGRHWRRATQDQRSDYQHLFGEYILKTYAKRLGGYSGESLSVVRTVPAGKRDIIVDTRIDRPSGPSLVAGWRVRMIGTELKIIDIVVGGVSMALTQRQEFDSVVKSRGLTGLLEALRARTDELSATAG